MGRGGTGGTRGGNRPQQEPHGYAGDTRVGTQSLPISQEQKRMLQAQEQYLVDHSGHAHNGGGGGRVATPSASHITDRPSRYRNMQSQTSAPEGFTPDIKGIATPKTNQYIDPKRNWSYLRRKRFEKISKGKKPKGDLPFEV